MVEKNLKRIIIAAVANNGVIGRNDKIPWYSKEELQHFKTTTLSYPIIFGRKTFQSISKPLKERLNIVITHNPSIISSKNSLFFYSVKNAYNYLRKNNYNKVFICGGSNIYRNTIKHADEMIISHMKFDVKGDKLFPKINMKLWEVRESVNYKEFVVKYYIRKNKSV